MASPFPAAAVIPVGAAGAAEDESPPPPPPPQETTVKIKSGNINKSINNFLFWLLGLEAHNNSIIDPLFVVSATMGYNLKFIYLYRSGHWFSGS
jgi:hypothetical protein